MRTKPGIPEKLIFGWLPAFLCAAVIFYISSRSASVLPSPWFPHMDKLVHAGEFGLLAFLVFRAMLWPQFKGFQRHQLVNAIISVMILASIYAAIDEIHQMYVPGRAAGFGDLLADISGAALAMLLCLYLCLPRK